MQKTILTDNMQMTIDALHVDARNILIKRVLPQNIDNVITLCNYTTSYIQESNPKKDALGFNVSAIARLSVFHKNKKSFDLMTKDDVLSFLQSFRKEDSNKWIGTYNLNRIRVLRFFKWLYYPAVPSIERSVPPIFKNITKLKRKGGAVSYLPEDMWIDPDVLLFLRYCPSVRNACYVAMAYNTAFRPSEGLRLRIRDIVDMISSTDKKFAVINIRDGKTGNREVPLTDSIPYVREWLRQHPQSGNTNSILLCGIEKSMGKAIDYNSIGHILYNYKKYYFPRLLLNTQIPDEDRKGIERLLLKPWNVYVFRHSGLTRMARLGLNESALRQVAGWTADSEMPKIYIHFAKKQGANQLLQLQGYEQKSIDSNFLEPKNCPVCKEPNKPDAKYCICGQVLTYDAYTEVRSNEVEDAKAGFRNELDELKRKYGL